MTLGRLQASTCPVQEWKGKGRFEGAHVPQTTIIPCNSQHPNQCKEETSLEVRTMLKSKMSPIYPELRTQLEKF